MRKATDPLDALALYLSQLFDTKVSLTDVFDVFAGIFVMAIAVLFLIRLKRASREDDREEE